MVEFDLTEGQRWWFNQSMEDTGILRLHAQQANKDRMIQREVFEVLLRNYFTLLVPSEHGGAGADLLTSAIVLAELAKGDPSVALCLAMHWFAVDEAKRPEVSEEARRRVFEAARTGLICAAISEAGSNSLDPFSFVPQLVTATPISGGGWKIKGQKQFVTGSKQAEHVMVYARLDGVTQPEGQNTTVCLLVPMSTKGVNPGNQWDEVPFMPSSNSHHIDFDAEVGPEAFVFSTTSFLENAIFNYGARTFGYMSVYLGLLERLLEIGLRDTRTFTEKVTGDFTEYVTEVGAARHMLEYSLWAYATRKNFAPRAMLQAKIAIGKAVAITHGIDSQVGLKGMVGKEISDIILNLRAARAMPPNFLAALVLVGNDIREKGLLPPY